MRGAIGFYLALVLFPNLGSAARPPLSSIPQVGPHYPLFVFEKSENPQNILQIYTQLDEKCRFLPDARHPDRPVLGFYWLMDRARFKAVHFLIRKGIEHRLQWEDGAPKSQAFHLRLKELTELQAIALEPVIEVSASTQGNQCEVETLLSLGPHADQEPLRLRSIYTEVRKTFLPPFRQVSAIHLLGKGVHTGKNVELTYRTHDNQHASNK